MDTETTVSLNQNYSDCQRAITNIGSTTYQNICNGTEAVVPWGVLDWVAAVIVAAVVISLIGIFAGIAREFFRD